MVICLIQARTGSQRLPRKVLMELPPDSGITLLERVIHRVKKAKSIDKIVLVSPDEELRPIAEKTGIGFSNYKPLKRDVIAEFYEAVKSYNPTYIVRVTADCPCLIPQTIDRLIEIIREGNADIVHNRSDNHPYMDCIDGLDVEVFTFRALKLAHENAIRKYELEHVTPWMYRCLETIDVESMWDIKDVPEIKLSINTQEDFDFVSCIYKKVGADFNPWDLTWAIQECWAEKGKNENLV